MGYGEGWLSTRKSCRGLSSTLYYLQRLGLQSLNSLPQSALSGIYGAIETLASVRRQPPRFPFSSTEEQSGSHVLSGMDLSLLLLSLGKLGLASKMPLVASLHQ